MPRRTVTSTPPSSAIGKDTQACSIQVAAMHIRTTLSQTPIHASCAMSRPAASGAPRPGKYMEA